MTPEEKLVEMNVKLPPPPTPVGAYVPTVRIGSLLWTSGQLPLRDGKLCCTGKVGKDLSVAMGQEAAKVAAVNALAAIKGDVGELSKVKRVVQLIGYVQSAPEFAEQHLVLNGASNLLLAALGEAGRHTRAAVGVAALPMNAPVEVCVLVEVAD